MSVKLNKETVDDFKSSELFQGNNSNLLKVACLVLGNWLCVSSKSFDFITFQYHKVIDTRLHINGVKSHFNITCDEKKLSMW